MTTFAIGDLQGCLDEFQALLKAIEFRTDCDQLWLTGDLVSRGPKSLETLRFVRSLGDAVTVTLGNHDLHLLASANDSERREKLDYDLSRVVDADDATDLLEWLRRQSIMHRDRERGITMIHAGLPPEWTIDTSTALAAELEQMLRSDQHSDFYQAMYGNEPDRWSEALSGSQRLRFICNCFTRLRYLKSDGSLVLKAKHAPDSPETDDDLLPWFTHPGRQTGEETIIFGHWSTLNRIVWPDAKVLGIDTGCVWGGTLTAINLDEGFRTTQVQSPGYKKPQMKRKKSKKKPR